MAKASGSIDLKSLKVAGEGASKYITDIGSGGIRVHDASNNSNYVAITSSGMEIYSGTNSSTKVAEFKSYINIGTDNTNTYTGSATIGTNLTAAKTNQIVIGRHNESNVNATFIIGDGTSSSDKSNLLTVGNIGGKQITDTFIGDGNTNTFTLSNIPASTPIIISTTTYTISNWSDTTITLTTNVVENERIQFQYTTNTKGGYLVIGNAGGIHGKGAIVGGDFDSSNIIIASGNGASIHGYATSNSTMTVSGAGASIHGHSYNSTMVVSDDGASIYGLALTNSTMTASSAGASIHGYAYHSTMTASGEGASIHGYADSGSIMTASRNGALICGYAFDNSTITASGAGASIHGYAYNSTMTASGNGALIHGLALTNSTMTASGSGSVALNEATHALKRAQVAIGSFNVDDSATTTTHPSGTRSYGTYAFIIGNGTADNARSNALTIDWHGNLITQRMAGIIQMFAGSSSTVPTGWLICDGSAVSRTTYKTLFDVIGTTYGSGDGSTTFNLPDFSGRIPVGVGTASANTDGTSTNATAHTLSEKKGNEDLIVPYHRHGITSVLETNSVAIAANRVGTVSSGGVTYVLRKTNNDIKGVTNTAYSSNDSTNATGANMMPYLTINYIICTGKTS